LILHSEGNDEQKIYMVTGSVSRQETLNTGNVVQKKCYNGRIVIASPILCGDSGGQVNVFGKWYIAFKAARRPNLKSAIVQSIS